MKAGSLNDSAADEYAQIEDDVKLTTHKKGYGILRKRHLISRARVLPTVSWMNYSQSMKILMNLQMVIWYVSNQHGCSDG